MKVRKKCAVFVSLFVALAMILSMSAMAFAAETESPTQVGNLVDNLLNQAQDLLGAGSTSAPAVEVSSPQTVGSIAEGLTTSTGTPAASLGTLADSVSGAISTGTSAISSVVPDLGVQPAGLVSDLLGGGMDMLGGLVGGALDFVGGIFGGGNGGGSGLLQGNLLGGIGDVFGGLIEGVSNVIYIADRDNEIALVVDIPRLLLTKMLLGEGSLLYLEGSLGKNLAKADLLGFQAELLDMVGVDTGLILREGANGMVVGGHGYLTWQDKPVLGLEKSAELIFPGAKLIPRGVQALIDILYGLAKPFLEMLGPFYHDEMTKAEPVKPAAPVTPTKPTGAPVTVTPTAEPVAAAPKAALPYTGANLAAMALLLLALAGCVLLLRRTERFLTARR